jgi:hypothetical protein
MPRKTFANGFPLPASDLNTYLMDQAVQTYADATARTAALPTPTEGQQSYLADTNTVYSYTGSAWVAQIDAANYGTFLPNGSAGKNKIINGDFGIWQRGTSTTDGGYLADRWQISATGETRTQSRQTFTPGSAPVSGYEAEAFYRSASTAVAGAGNFTQFIQRIEDVRVFAGQTVTFSYWAKADSAKSIAIELQQVFGSGGSTNVNTFVAKQALTTSWTRYTHTFTVPSMTGKTIGGGSYADIRFWLSAGSSFDARTGTLGQQDITFDVWGVQLEAGSVATQFATSTGTKQGELAACQRYYLRTTAFTAYNFLSVFGVASSITNALINIPLLVTMRVIPTSIGGANLSLSDGPTNITVSSVTLDANTNRNLVTVNATASGLTQFRSYCLRANNSTSAYFEINAEF